MIFNSHLCHPIISYFSINLINLLLTFTTFKILIITSIIPPLNIFKPSKILCFPKSKPISNWLMQLKISYTQLISKNPCPTHQKRIQNLHLFPTQFHTKFFFPFQLICPNSYLFSFNISIPDLFKSWSKLCSIPIQNCINLGSF